MGGTGGPPVALGGSPKACLRAAQLFALGSRKTARGKNHHDPPGFRSLREKSARRAAGQDGPAARSTQRSGCTDRQTTRVLFARCFGRNGIISLGSPA